LPPALSGIADYSAELLEPLRAYFDIDVVVSPGETVNADLSQRHLVLAPEDAARRNADFPYDLFVYHVGNSHHHVYMLDLLRRYRGLVVLHDFYLGGLVLPASQYGAWPGELAAELEFEGQAGMAATLRSGRVDGHHVMDRVPLNRRILSLAGSVVVHSRWSWKRVREVFDGPIARIPHSAPLPTLKSPDEERRRLGLPLDRFLIATLGFVGRPKRIPSILHALAALPIDLRQKMDLIIVGYAPPSEERSLRELADELGLTWQVRWLGRVPFADFPAYARAADACVQLRYPTRGETSGALLRNLAAGAACIVSDHGAIAELPDDVAIKVRTPDHEVEDLTAALLRLHNNPAERQRLREKAIAYVKAHHDLDQVVQQYAAAIELAASDRAANHRHWIEQTCDALAECPAPPSERALQAWAEMAGSNGRSAKTPWPNPTKHGSGVIA
jgi:glycosyltransferase involved in cell wall biosynthesis